MLPPLPAHRGYAKETVELSHQLDGMLRVYRGDRLLRSQPLPLEEYADGRPVQISATQKKSPMPRIYKLSGRPALAAVTYQGGDIVSWQLARHNLVATTALQGTPCGPM